MSRLLPKKVTEQIGEYNKKLDREKLIVFVATLAIWHFFGPNVALLGLGLACWIAICDLRRESYVNSMLAQYQIGMLDYLED
jgi:hypothetical protein